jgi:hypothetical protein
VRVARLLPSLEETQRRNHEWGRWVAPARVAALSAQQAARACADETLDTTALPAAAVAARLAPFLGGSPGGGAQPNRGSRGGSG